VDKKALHRPPAITQIQAKGFKYYYAPSAQIVANHCRKTSKSASAHFKNRQPQ
jgi:hypothetical protein